MDSNNLVDLTTVKHGLTVAPDINKPTLHDPEVMALRAQQHQYSFAAQIQGKGFYEGTVPHAEKARRRAKNKVARASRKANRSR